MYPANKKKVCVIGAGPRGLAAARHLSEAENVEVVIFEAQNDIGGVWVYNERHSLDPNFEEKVKDDNYYRLYSALPNSIYSSLITNAPYFAMEFKDLGMRDVIEDVPLYPTLSHYKKYLDAYAEKFNLRKITQLETLVISIRLTKNLSEQEKLEAQCKQDRKYVIKTASAKGKSLDDNIRYHDFDYVVVVGGQFSVPYIPDIKGAEKFEGNIIHTKEFRCSEKEAFKDKKVLILGGNFSAFDMLNQLLSEKIRGRPTDCKKVILCARKAEKAAASSEDYKPYIDSRKLSIHSGFIKEFVDAKTVLFSDGSLEEIDSVIFATGYKLKFPYLDYKKDKIIDHDEKEHRGVFFGPTYRRFISIREPSLFFIGYIAHTPLLDIIPELQSMVVKALIENKLELPPKEEMMKFYDSEVAEHKKYVGDLAHFQKLNLAKAFPGMSDSNDLKECEILRDWLKPLYPNNNEEKAAEYYDRMAQVKKIIYDGYMGDSKYISYRSYDLYQIFPKELRNTSEFL